MLTDLNKVFLPLLLAGFILFPLGAHAQSGSAGGAANPTPTTSAALATSTPSATAVPRATSSPTSVPGATVPRPTPTPVPTTSPATSSSTQDALVALNIFTDPIVWAVLAFLALLPFGYLVTQSLKKKKVKQEKEEDRGCFNLKKLIDEKIREITDLRGKLEGKIKGAAKEALHEAVKGSYAGDTLALLEKAEKEYGRLKKLYEECTIELEKKMYTGTIIENSLSDTKILEKIKIKETRHSGDWTLHKVLVTGDQIGELSKHLAEGPWYSHFWKSGDDTIKVVFKDKLFTIKSRDKSTWGEAIAHGRTLGIPVEQLDFPTTT